MRVISGTQKGKILKAVPGKGTRPTVDKIKESVFNIIGPYFDGGIALDLYAGTGGLGIEGLSRGMERVIFVDLDRKAIEIIKENLTSTQFLDRAEVYKNDSAKALKALVKREVRFDFVFLDPPYAKQKVETEIAIMQDYALLHSQAIIIVETDEAIVLQETIGKSIKIKDVEYGNTRISVYRYEA